MIEFETTKFSRRRMPKRYEQSIDKHMQLRFDVYQKRRNQSSALRVSDELRAKRSNAFVRQRRRYLRELMSSQANQMLAAEANQNS